MEANPSGATTIEGAVARLTTPLVEEREPTETGVEAQEVPKTEDVATETETPAKGDTESEVERYTVKVNGEEREVTLDEMRSGYMMESDYRKKSTDVAEKRKALDAKGAEVDQQLAEARSLLQSELENLNTPEMQELKESDPEAYVKESDRLQGKATRLNALIKKRQEEQQAQNRELAATEVQLLKTAIPEWLDSDVEAKEATAIMQRWSDQGYSNEEIGAVLDHRRFVSERKAMLYDQLMSQDLSKKEVKAVPKSQQPSTTTAERTDPKVKGLRGKFNKSRRHGDAAKLIRSLME